MVNEPLCNFLWQKSLVRNIVQSSCIRILAYLVSELVFLRVFDNYSDTLFAYRFEGKIRIVSVSQLLLSTFNLFNGYFSCKRLV